MISHKGTLYPREQEAMVRGELWDEVHDKLARKGKSQRGRPHDRQQALLLDLLRCRECGARMHPTFTTTRGQRYRYYACERAKRRECRSEERRVGKECRSRWSPYH